jgi:hypothetical protein
VEVIIFEVMDWNEWSSSFTPCLTMWLISIFHVLIFSLNCWSGFQLF